MDLRRLSTVADFFVIGTARSARQLAALTEHLEAQLQIRGERVHHIEGKPVSLAAADHPAASWVLLDCGDLVIHLFDPAARVFYQLERLWADAPRIPLDAVA